MNILDPKIGTFMGIPKENEMVISQNKRRGGALTFVIKFRVYMEAIYLNKTEQIILKRIWGLRG
jgi:hypothetical protein